MMKRGSIHLGNLVKSGKVSLLDSREAKEVSSITNSSAFQIVLFFGDQEQARIPDQYSAKNLRYLRCAYILECTEGVK